MTNTFKQSNVPFLLLILYVSKALFLPASLFDGISILALSVLFGFKLYLDHIKKPDFSQEVLNKIEALRNETKSNIHDLDIVNKERLKEFDGKISAVTLAVSHKSKGNSNEFKWG